MKPSKFFSALLINLLIAALFSTALGTALIPTYGVVLVGGAGIHLVKSQFGFSLFDGLAAEVWIPDVKDNFYPDWSFMREPQDMSALVEADAINLAEAGADPAVLVDNTSYPVGAADAGDSALRMVLKTYDTESTIVRNAVAVELSYDQRQLYTRKHQNALLNKFAFDGAYAYAPTANATLKPVLDASGDNANEILDRIIDLQTAYNTIDAPTEGRILVLDPTHAAIIAKEDKKLYKSFESNPGSMLFGFKVYMYSRNPIYLVSNKNKAAQGTAFVSGTHLRSSFSFLKGETMKAQGTFKFFSALNDPAAKGDIFNYQMRALASKIRDKYVGAILK